MELDKIYLMDCLEGIERMKENNIVPNLIVCDPPYEFDAHGRGINKGRKLQLKIKSANLNVFNFEKFIPDILDLQGGNVNAYFFCNKALLPKYLLLAIERGLNFDILTMNKKAPIPCKNSAYLPEIEYIVFLRSKGVYWNGKLDYKLYFKSHSVVTNGLRNEHPTQKPISIIRKFIQLSSDENHLVLDCFMGSGTTAIASKELNRRFIGFENNEEYFKLADKRVNVEVKTLLNCY
ncbi:MAG: site-specific DNA-methyltransferase [Candidatus Woesearchaeota archaeon]|jgi:DNA modification methylase|nr:site-specific DNA-methyltransferase [Candidatus Woesearchaeota archaeon]